MGFLAGATDVCTLAHEERGREGVLDVPVGSLGRLTTRRMGPERTFLTCRYPNMRLRVLWRVWRGVCRALIPERTLPDRDLPLGREEAAPVPWFVMRDGRAERG